ncbi:MAG: hypothetical protein WD894_10550 [Pirellulales bacterium]
MADVAIKFAEADVLKHSADLATQVLNRLPLFFRSERVIRQSKMSASGMT